MFSPEYQGKMSRVGPVSLVTKSDILKVEYWRFIQYRSK